MIKKEPWKKTVLFQCSITLQNQTKHMINVIISLTLLRRMKLPTFIKYTSPFFVFCVVEYCYSNFNRTSCKQTVESLIRHDSVVVDWLLIVTPIVRFCNCSMFCCALLYVHSSFASILMAKRKLVALLSLSSWCLVIVVWLFLAEPWVRSM